MYDKIRSPGGMAEWTKAAVLKTAVGLTIHQGFESLSLRLRGPISNRAKSLWNSSWRCFALTSEVDSVELLSELLRECSR